MGGNDRKDDKPGKSEAHISRSQARREQPRGNPRRKAIAEKVPMREPRVSAAEVAGADEGQFVPCTDTYHLGW